MDESALAKRVLQLEIALASLQSEYRGHVELCTARWGVVWKLAGGLSALVAAVVSAAISMART
jgi:hypothetical protein